MKEKEIIRIDLKKPLIAPRKRVAAYCRVSEQTERLSHSLAAQTSYYNRNKTFVVNEAEAEVIRKIFSDYLEGLPIDEIARRVGFSHFRVAYILQNEVYRGDVELQKTFKVGPLDRQRPNRGELPSYYVSENHEAIVLPEVWDAVQKRSKPPAKPLRKENTDLYRCPAFSPGRSCAGNMVRTSVMES